MVKIVEVGPRDGLQNETAPVPTPVKVNFVNALSESGVNEIEVSAFVSPRWVPQLGDAEAVFKNIRRRQGVLYSALVPNEKGFERAIEAGAGKISIITAASETFNCKNINTTTEGSIRRIRPIVKRAQATGLQVRGYVSTAFWCAFEGRIKPPAVMDVVKKLVDIGINEVSISDTIGKASPEEVCRLLDCLLPILPSDQIYMHFHDTYGMGTANVLASWDYGIHSFDASVGGLGGCPYAPGATGNVATEHVVTALAAKRAAVTVDLRQLARARRLLDPYLADDRRTMPPDGSPACEACEFVRGDNCCQRTQPS